MNEATAIVGLIAAASVGLAVALAVISYRTLSFGRSSPVWEGKARDLDRRIGALDGLLGSYPGLALVWPAGVQSPAGSGSNGGEPRLFGSTAALASLKSLAGATKADADAVVAGLSRLDVVGGEDFGTLVAGLRTEGKGFAVSLLKPDGGVVEATGRAAGAQAVVWLDDPAARGTDDREAMKQLQQQRGAALRDPTAFVDMLDAVGFPAWRVDGAGRMRWANRAYLAAVDRPSLDALLKSPAHLDAATDSQIQRTLLDRAPLREARPMVIGGRRRAMQVTTYPLRGGAAGYAVDASEAESLRSALVSHVRAHDETLDALSEGVVIFGPDQRMRFHNRAFSEIFGLEEAWYEGSPSHGEWLERLREARALPEQADFSSWKRAELALYTDWPDEVPDELWSLPDGRTLRVVRQRDPEGGLLILFGDMTDQLTLQSQLGTLISVQRATLDRLTEGISVWGTDGRLRLHNQAFAKQWSLRETDLDGGPRFRDLRADLLRLLRDEPFWLGMEARVTDPDPDVRRTVEGTVERSDGRVFRWLSRPLPDGATLIAWDDQTEARSAERALRDRNEALEEANRVKSDFVGHVSYQLRTPLTTISGYADLLQAGTMGELNDRQSEGLFAVQSAAGDLAKSIDDILDIAAIDANVLDLDLGDVDVADVLDTTLDYVGTRAEDTRIQLHMDVGPDVGIIRADEARIKQVVYNLLLNALRFTKPGGHITLGARRSDGGVRIWVEDTGVGIPTEAQPTVFESFRSTRGGTGLGLALVEKFIDRHGGWVELDSEEGRGTRVDVYLPAVAQATAAHPELQLPAPAAAPRTEPAETPTANTLEDTDEPVLADSFMDDLVSDS